MRPLTDRQAAILRAEGEAKAFGHYPTADDDINSQTLMCEPSGLNTELGPVKFDKVPTL